MDFPYISVVIPLYNSEDTILPCLLSVIDELESVHSRWEVLIVDDGSTDNSVNIVSKYVYDNDLNYFVKIFHQINQGAAAARNRGLIEANGDFIAFNDSDDMWIKGKLEAQLNVFKTHSDVVMVGGMHDVYSFSSLWKKWGNVADITIHDLIYKFYFTTPGVIFKRGVLTKTGLFNPLQRNAEEGLFFYRMTYYGKCVLVNMVFTRNISGKKSWGESGLSSQIHRQSIGELRNLFVVYQENLINSLSFFSAFLFSIMKYIRRIIVYYFKVSTSILPHG